MKECKQKSMMCYDYTCHYNNGEVCFESNPKPCREILQNKFCTQCTQKQLDGKECSFEFHSFPVNNNSCLIMNKVRNLAKNQPFSWYKNSAHPEGIKMKDMLFDENEKDKVEDLIKKYKNPGNLPSEDFWF